MTRECKHIPKGCRDIEVKCEECSHELFFIRLSIKDGKVYITRECEDCHLTRLMAIKDAKDLGLDNEL